MAEPETDNQNNKHDPLRQELEALEMDVLRKLEEKVDLKKMEEEATGELASVGGSQGSTEQLLLMIAAGMMLIVLPLLHYVIGAFLTFFAILISFVAGLTSPKKPYSAALNLIVSAVGILFFEYSAIFEFHTGGATLLFWFCQALAFLFLFASYFSMGSYRRKVLEKET